MAQQKSLFDVAADLQTAVITKPGHFDTLFEGFSRLRCISYVTSGSLLLELVHSRGFESVELIVGEDLGPLERESLANEGASVVERLAAMVESGKLTVHIPKRVIHSKLYVLEGAGRNTRVIQTSANFTETARKATRQTNYAWFVDLPNDHPALKRLLDDYDEHMSRCTPFLGDLLDLFRQSPETPREVVVEHWLSGVTGSSGTTINAALAEVSDWALSVEPAAEEPVYTIHLPEASSERRQAEKVLTALGATPAGRDLRVKRDEFLIHVEQTLGLPKMTVDTARQEVRIGLDGARKVLSEPIGSAAEVLASLIGVESYIDTIDRGKTLHPVLAKTAMYEALLYMLASPFADLHMRIMRERFGNLERRGPKMLYLVGPSSNGKTTFFRYALLLISGKQLTPLVSTDLTKTRIRNAIGLKTCFPLVFDDVNPSQKNAFEEILKSHWETWWTREGVSPQIAISSNKLSLPEWAKSRVKRIDFDVHFASSQENLAHLSRIFAQPNRLFGWFSTLYFEELQAKPESNDDELLIARRVIRRLYERAGRELPPFFPVKRFEELFDPGRVKWQDLLQRSHQGRLREDGQRAIVEFKEDIQHFEITRYIALLPQIVKHEHRGSQVIIENPEEFRAWLGVERKGVRGLIDQIARRIS